MSQEVWGLSGEIWNTTEEFWYGAVEVLEEIRGGRSGGYLRRKQDMWNAWDNLSEKNKKKFFKVLVKIKGIEYKDSKEIKNYKVTVKDVKIVMDEYEKIRNIIIENIEII